MVFKYKRWCHIKQSSKCPTIFISKHRRGWACKHCLEQINKIGLTMWRFKKMQKETIIDEKVEWEEDGLHCKLIRTEEKPVKDGEQIVGTKKEVIKVRVSREALESNLNIEKEMLDKNEIKLEAAIKQLEATGKLAGKTSEMVRLQKNMQELGKFQEQKKIRDQIKALEEGIRNSKISISKREGQLKNE